MIKLAINNKFIEYKKFNFPVGEMHLVVPYLQVPHNSCDIFFEFEKNEEIIELLLLVDAIKNSAYQGQINLFLPYVPFSRQDRVNEIGECFSLRVFADLINRCNFRKVFIKDPHSDVTTALINNCLVSPQEDIWHLQLEDKKDFYLISPDAGALKKINKLAAGLGGCIDVVICSKIRNTQTGKISGVKVHAEDLLNSLSVGFNGKDCYIVDDICDGGGTFVAIAKELKKYNCGKIVLMVTHGFFTKGLEVFDGLIDEIYTYKGRVK